MGTPAPPFPDRGAFDDPPIIDAGMLDRAVDFERGMSAVPLVSLALMAVCLAVFACQAAQGALDRVDKLIALGALDRKPVAQGEVWRLVSATFLHGGLDHLAGNLIMLYILGMACEHAYGRLQHVSLYALAGVGGSAASLIGANTSVGASGAIFGLGGALIVLFWRHRDVLRVRDKRIGLAVGLWAAYQLLLGSLTPGIDNLAHLGGLASGMLIGLVLQPALVTGREQVASHPAVRACFLGVMVCWAATAVAFVPRLAG
jgi:rhomboid protease GluP